MREAWGIGRRPGGTHEPWRAAVTRWGDQLWGQALLFANQRAAAEQALVDAFCHVFGGVAPVDAELALYAALAAQRGRRWLPIRGRILSRRLSRIAPQDRLLLGLWLVREANGTRLAE